MNLALPATIADGLTAVQGLDPGHGWAQLGASWDPQGWLATAEVGARTGWGALFGDAWLRQDAGGVGVGVRW